jgi:hypothetical protein
MSTLRNIVAAAVVTGVTSAVSNPETAAQQGDRPIITQEVMKRVEPIIASATNNEPWYQSRVTWGAILAGVAGVLGVFGKAELLPAELQGRIVDGIVAAGPLIAMGVVLYGRYVARKPIGS